MDFEDYVHGHSRQLLRLATVLARDRGSGEDIVQEVLIRARLRWAMIAELPYPQAYLRQMVVNESISWRRKWARIEPRPVHDLDRPAPGRTDQVTDRDELLTEIAKLAPKVRAAIVLRYFEDLPDDEIADLLSCRAVTVRGYIHRGLTALRIELASGTDHPSKQTGSATRFSIRKASP